MQWVRAPSSLLCNGCVHFPGVLQQPGKASPVCPLFWEHVIRFRNGLYARDREAQEQSRGWSGLHTCTPYVAVFQGNPARGSVYALHEHGLGSLSLYSVSMLD
jgi:hypothetical protein